MAVDHPTLCRLIHDLAEKGEHRGDYATHSFDVGDELSITTFRKRAGYSMIRLSKADQEDIGTFIQIAGGGAVNVPASSDLCQSILERHINIDWGGPFVRSWPNGTMTYGTQMVMPAAALSMDVNSMGFLMAMIDLFGEIARSIAVELIPRYGGDLLDGSRSNDENDLFVALIGPAPPDLG